MFYCCCHCNVTTLGIHTGRVTGICRTGKWQTGKWRSRTRANVYCIQWQTLMCTTCNCFKHKSKDIYYTAFRVILIKNLIKKEIIQWPQYVMCPSVVVYVYVITWSTEDYTSVTSIIHCRPCYNDLISWLWQTSSSVSSSGRRVSGRCYQHVHSIYNLQLSSWSCWWRLLFIVRLLSIVKIWSAV